MWPMGIEMSEIAGCGRALGPPQRRRQLRAQRDRKGLVLLAPPSNASLLRSDELAAESNMNLMQNRRA
jgi:hypothetical protein